MFCLRTWIPVLFFLTNVSPIYLILFISATYYLHRPCLYCSLLLTILVLSLYDFRTDWFEPRDIASTASLQSLSRNNQTSNSLHDVALEAASLAASFINSTAASAAQSALQGVKRRVMTDEQPSISAAQWLKELLGKKEWRIPCIDVAVRL